MINLVVLLLYALPIPAPLMYKLSDLMYHLDRLFDLGLVVPLG